MINLSDFVIDANLSESVLVSDISFFEKAVEVFGNVFMPYIMIVDYQVR